MSLLSRLPRPIWPVVAAATLGLDLWTKALAREALPPLGGSLPVIDGFLSLTLVFNTGAAFGVFSEADPILTARLLNVVGVVAVIFVCYLLATAPATRRRLLAGLSLVLGGAVGNLVDRFTRGYVVDFIEVYWRSFHWPNFNVADTAICIGVGLLLIDSFRPESESAEAQS